MTNCDLGENVAINMASDGVIKGLSAQRPYDQGVTEAMLAGYGLLGKTAPAYCGATRAAGHQGQSRRGLEPSLPQARH